MNQIRKFSKTKINDNSEQNLKDALPLMRHSLTEIEDHLETALFYDTEFIDRRLKTIRKVLFEMTKANRTLLVSEGA